MILTICIPTLPEYKSQQHLHYLMSLLEPQLTDDVEVIIDPRNRQTPTGTKRNDMYQKAKGLYVCSVDCDDWIASDYVSSILDAAQSVPDVITFDGWYTENGHNKLDWTIKLGETYEARHDAKNGGKYMIFRFPNHLVPIKKSIAIKARFPDTWIGEDFEWAKQINDARQINKIWHSGPNALPKTEVHIYKQLYHYVYRTDK